MRPFVLLPVAAAVASIAIALLSIARTAPSVAARCFAAGMVLLGVDSLCTARALLAADAADVQRWLTYGMGAKSLLPATWLAFSLTYGRGDWRERRGSTLLLSGIATLPLAIALVFHDRLLHLVSGEGDAWMVHSLPAALALQGLLLLAFVLVLMNLEQTYRAAVGTMRWRIKYVVVGVSVICVTQIYLRSQAMLYSAYDTARAGVESSALLIGCALLVLARMRADLGDVAVYPSHAVVRSSLTIIVAGSYLLVVGVLAQAARHLGGNPSFQLQAVVILLGAVGLAVLLLSDRVGQRVQSFIGQHFSKAQYDSTRIWTDLSGRFATVRDEASLWAESARTIGATFDVLSVTVWVREADGTLAQRASTASMSIPAHATTQALVPASLTLLGDGSRPVNVDRSGEPRTRELMAANPATFGHGGDRFAVALRSTHGVEGMIVLADRVNGVPYSAEELDLLQCIADQATATLMNLRLADAVAQSRELDAFRSMSAFFVHDLKNAAASMNLMLKNLPIHFEDPSFRADALRGIGNTARRIDEMIERLGALRHAPRLALQSVDVNTLVEDATAGVPMADGVILEKHLAPVPPLMLDRERMSSVVTNLLLNARDAVADSGRIGVRTSRHDDRVQLTVADDGCGMTPTFLREGLFRPFQSTKSKGLGIGMFQSRMVVEAHGGAIRVDSEVGKGTTIHITLPIKPVQ